VRDSAQTAGIFTHYRIENYLAFALPQDSGANDFRIQKLLWGRNESGDDLWK
jgi:hypothetical protein